MTTERTSRSGYPNKYARDVIEDTYSGDSDSATSYSSSPPPPSDISSTTAQRQWRFINQQLAEVPARNDAYHEATHDHSQEGSKYDRQEFRLGSLDSYDHLDLSQHQPHALSHASSRIRAPSSEAGDNHNSLMPPPSRPRTSQKSLGPTRRPRKNDHLLKTEDECEAPPKRRKTTRSHHNDSNTLSNHVDHLGPSTSSPRIPTTQPKPPTSARHPTPSSLLSDPSFSFPPTPKPSAPTYPRQTPGLFLTPEPASPPTTTSAAPAAALDPTAPTLPPSPSTHPTHLARLRAMAATPSAHPYTRKRAPERDPENLLIKTLRQHSRLHWSAIAAHLNTLRVAAGRVPSFTVAAVYGRFARVAPRIAEAEGEAGFDYRDWLYFKGGEGEGPKGERKGGRKLTEGEERVLVECYEEVERERWGNLARRFKMRAGVEMSAEEVARRWRML